MSQIASPRRRTPFVTWASASLGLALAAAAIWVLAGIVDDGLYAVTGILGIAALATGLMGRKEAKRAGVRSWQALVAIALGGLLGGAVLVATVVYIVSDVI